MNERMRRDHKALMQEAYARAMDSHAEREVELKLMLGQWVSGLEPAIAYGPRMELLGLTIVGLPAGSQQLLVVKAWGRE